MTIKSTVTQLRGTRAHKEALRGASPTMHLHALQSTRVETCATSIFVWLHMHQRAIPRMSGDHGLIR
jgi:hypothetical protein